MILMSSNPDFNPGEGNWLEEEISWFEHEIPEGYNEDAEVYRTFVGFPNNEGMMVIAWVERKTVVQHITTVEGQISDIGVHGKNKGRRKITVDDTSMYGIFKANMATIKDIMERDNDE
jgi:hypothetical protein